MNITNERFRYTEKRKTKMAAACLISLPGEAWPLVRKAQIEAATDKEELMEEARLEARNELNKARIVLERWNDRSTNYFNTKLRPVKWSEITEEEFVEITSETERFITGYMVAADRLEHSLCNAEKLKMWIFKEMDILEDVRATIEIWVDQMNRLRKWQTEMFGQV